MGLKMAITNAGGMVAVSQASCTSTFLYKIGGGVTLGCGGTSLSPPYLGGYRQEDQEFKDRLSYTENWRPASAI